MATFFGEVTTGSFRYFDDEDEDYIQDAESRAFSVSSPCVLEKNLLLVGEGELSAVYLQLCADSQKVGSVIATGHRESEIGIIYRGENWTAVSCTGELHMAEFNSLANTILGMAEPTATIVCLTSRHVSELRGIEEERGETVVKCLHTKSFKSTDKIDRLEAPNILTGLSAGILSIAAVKGLAGGLLVNYVDVPNTDSLSLNGFQAVDKFPAVKASSLKRPTDLASSLKALRPTSHATNLYM